MWRTSGSPNPTSALKCPTSITPPVVRRGCLCLQTTRARLCCAAADRNRKLGSGLLRLCDPTLDERTMDPPSAHQGEPLSHPL